jgi:hypothetical protein
VVYRLLVADLFLLFSGAVPALGSVGIGYAFSCLANKDIIFLTII